MILTLTPNPSVDHTLEVDGLVRGEVLRVHATRSQAGGKGVNVARALLAGGGCLCCAGLTGVAQARIRPAAMTPLIVRETSMPSRMPAATVPTTRPR